MTTQVQVSLAEVTRRVVSAVKPKRIILFGSAARNQMGPHSDLDLIVVMPEGTPRRPTAQSIYEHLVGAGQATDIIVAWESDLIKHRDNSGLIFQQALIDGVTVYAA